MLLAAAFAASCTPVEQPEPGRTPEPDKPVIPVLPDDDPEEEMGWYDATWIRYEAEADASTGRCTYTSQSDNKRDVQNEATHQKAAQLVAEGDYVEWTCREAADGMVIRFSLPDAPEGGGTKGNIALYVEEEKICDIELDSYHAWQWKKTGVGAFNWHYDNTPAPDKYSRMAFDEKRVLLEEKIGQDKKFRLVKTDDNTVPYTIDFVELEPVPEPLSYLDVMDGTTICFEPDPENPNALSSFIRSNPGYSIYIPAGHYDLDWHFDISVDNTKLIGAGPWYTELHFIADPEDRSTVNRRGINGLDSPRNCGVKNLYMDTRLERRYLDYHGEGGSNGIPPGKGLNGSWGDDFIAENVWIEHFECGAWIVVGENSKISHCRMRNNYADGINVEQGNNLVISRCNSRNNGDDQLVLHYSGTDTEVDLSSVVHHCTIELGWRAGGICIPGGGYNIDIHNVLVDDHFESGIRFLSEFPDEYTVSRNISLSRIRLQNCGCRGGSNPLEYGTSDGGSSSALWLSITGIVNVENITLSDIEIINPRSNGFGVSESGGSVVRNFHMDNITIRNWTPSYNGNTYYGVFFNEGAAGEIKYSNLVLQGDESTGFSPIPDSMVFEETTDNE